MLSRIHSILLYFFLFNLSLRSNHPHCHHMSSSSAIFTTCSIASGVKSIHLCNRLPSTGQTETTRPSRAHHMPITRPPHVHHAPINPHHAPITRPSTPSTRPPHVHHMSIMRPPHVHHAPITRPPHLHHALRSATPLSIPCKKLICPRPTFVLSSA